MAQEGGPDGGIAPGLVSCQLTLAAPAARPGDTVTGLLQVSCSQPEALELQEVEIEFTGVERVDTSWVLPTYRRATPAINADKRKVQRIVAQSKLQAATQGTFSDLSLRRFVVRFTLPTWLPPTFRGTAVRYLYYLQVLVKYRPVPLQGEDAAAAGGAGAAQPAPATGSVAARVPLHIWPARQQQLESAALERTPSLLSPSSGGPAGAAAGGGGQAALDGSLLSPPMASEDVPIKCWEIGPGTAVQDAVAHIVKLASQPPPAGAGRPQSPGHLPRSNGGSRRGSGLLGAEIPGPGSGAGDTQSEISHDPDELETGPTSASSGRAAPAAGSLPGSAQLPLAQQAAQQAAQPREQSAASSTVGSSASTPRSSTRLTVRKPSLTRASLEAGGGGGAAKSPTHLDGSSAFRSYALRIGEQPLVRVSLHPPLEGRLQPGATLAGTLDFASPAGPAAAAAGGGQAAGQGPRCMQVLILLETEELVEQPWRRPVQGGGSGAIRRVHDEHVELTPDTSCTHFMFTIPPDAPASFHTPLMQLRWVLRFQFTAASPPAGAGGAGAEWSPLQGRVEQLTWTLPITVLSPTV